MHNTLQKEGLVITTVCKLFVEKAHLSLTLSLFLYGADIYLDGGVGQHDNKKNLLQVGLEVSTQS